MNAPTATPAVEARELRFAYPERVALDGVSFRVDPPRRTRPDDGPRGGEAPGTLFGFLGPNGGGKTTLFRILATLLPPEAGTVCVFGHRLPEEAAAVRRRLGVVFQSPSLDLELTVRENLVHQGRLHGLTGKNLAAAIIDALGRLGIADRAGERAKALSGGLRRRAEIAKSLLHRPDVLLLDEPSTGLDPGARRELWRTLDELRGGGMTVLLTTHFIEEAERCDRLLLLDRGRIVAAGSPEELESEIGGDVVTVVPRDGDAGPARSLADEITERFPELNAEAFESSSDGAVRFEREDAHRFVARLAEAFPGRIESLTVSRPTLEDVFLRHTGHGLYEGPER